MGAETVTGIKQQYSIPTEITLGPGAIQQRRDAAKQQLLNLIRQPPKPFIDDIVTEIVRDYDFTKHPIQKPSFDDVAKLTKERREEVVSTIASDLADALFAQDPARMMRAVLFLNDASLYDKASIERIAEDASAKLQRHQKRDQIAGLVEKLSKAALFQEVLSNYQGEFPSDVGVNAPEKNAIGTLTDVGGGHRGTIPIFPQPWNTEKLLTAYRYLKIPQPSPGIDERIQFLRNNPEAVNGPFAADIIGDRFTDAVYSHSAKNLLPVARACRDLNITNEPRIANRMITRMNNPTPGAINNIQTSVGKLLAGVRNFQ